MTQRALNLNSQRLARVQAWLGERSFAEYIGVETRNWTVENFDHWVDTVTPNQPDVAYIKVGEYGQMWYNGHFPTIRDYFIQHGIGVAPYIFCRPQWVQQDAAIAAEVAKLCGGVVLDCEEQWLNNNTELYRLIATVRSLAGTEPVIVVSGYGDPLTAVPGWDFGALHPADAYQPQWYCGWWEIYQERGFEAAISWGDGQLFQEFSKGQLASDFPIQPDMNVEGMRPKDIGPLAKYLTQWKTGVTVWEAMDISAETRGIIKAACKE